MIRLSLLLTLLLAVALPARAAETGEEVVLGLSQQQVQITTGFTGSKILIFGAIKREAPIDPEELEVVVAIAGPSLPLIVRRKERQFGIWMNTDSVEIDRAPSFYAVATSGPLREVLTWTEDLRHRVSIPRMIRSVGAPGEVQDARAFTDAVIRIRQNNDLYQTLEGAVEVTEQTLFQTSIAMPANLTEGDYLTRVFLTRDGRVVNEFETVIDVRKVGLERFLFNLSRNQPLIYGLLSLLIAIIAGWGASAAFRLMQRN
ncbi:hypothetical protein E0K89_004610 [Aquicoccus sp. SCR17]|nr:hypothetical protein [Carideicomes alvinocaridis]